MTSQSCDKTYLEWVAAAHATFPDIRKYLAYANFFYTSRTMLLPPGTVYRNRKILDLQVYRKPRRWSRLLYKVECLHCGHVYWTDNHTLTRLSENCCVACNPILKHGNPSRKYPDFEIGARVGRLTVIKNGTVMRRTKNKYGQPIFKKQRAVYTRCDCGNEQWVLFGNLYRGRSTQCVECGNRNRRKKKEN